MASFTGVGDAIELQVPVKGTVVDIDISGTYNMTILFQRESGSPGSGAWETLKTFSTANATVAEVYTTESANEKVRLFVSVDTSGTATATLTDNDNKSVGSLKDGAGNDILEYKEGGIKVTGAIERADAVVLIAAPTTLTAEKHAGKVMVFNVAAGVAVTLPAATGTGNTYTFVVGVTVTSAADVIQCANTTDEFVGNLLQVDTDTSDALVAYPALDGDGFDTITLDGTDGGLMGDRIVIQDVAVGKFSLSGTVLGTGTVGSPLSAA